MKPTEIKRRPLADTVLATLEPDTKEYREHDGNSLYLRSVLTATSPGSCGTNPMANGHGWGLGVIPK